MSGRCTRSCSARFPLPDRLGMHSIRPCPKLRIKYNNLLETGIPAVGDEVEIEINAEVIKDAPGKDPPTK